MYKSVFVSSCVYELPSRWLCTQSVCFGSEHSWILRNTLQSTVQAVSLNIGHTGLCVFSLTIFFIISSCNKNNFQCSWSRTISNVYLIYVCICMSKTGRVSLKQEPSTGQLQLVQAEANTDWLIKSDERLKGQKADL